MLSVEHQGWKPFPQVGNFLEMRGAVRHADRKCKAKTNLVSVCGKPNLGEYTAKPHLPVKENLL